MSDVDSVEEVYAAPVDKSPYGTIVQIMGGACKAVLMRWDEERGCHVEEKILAQNSDRSEAETAGRPYCANLGIQWRG